MGEVAKHFRIRVGELAQICEQLDVPYPKNARWARTRASESVVVLPLRNRKDGGPEWVDILHSAGKSAGQLLSAAPADSAAPPKVRELHPLVHAWLTHHQERQAERAREIWRHRFEKRQPPPIADATARDIYRLKMTSAILIAVEKTGGQVKDAYVTGKVRFLVGGHEVTCSIAEKLVRSTKSRQEAGKWTTIGYGSRSGYESSGLLRVSILTWLGRKKSEWVESRKKSLDDYIPEIVAAIIGAGPILEEHKREQEEQARKSREQEARRFETRRPTEKDDKRWRKFRGYAAAWEERSRLQLFMAEVEARLLREGDANAGDRPLNEWGLWARRRVDALDPFGDGVAGMFTSISQVNEWTPE